MFIASVLLVFRCKALRSDARGFFCLGNLKAGFQQNNRNEKLQDMKFLTLEEIKEQCRIESDFTLEDALLTAYGGAAENALLRVCNRTYDDLLDNFGEDDGEGGKVVPHDFRIAALMLAKHLYEHRGPTENVPIYMVPYAIDFLVKPFIRLSTLIES